MLLPNTYKLIDVSDERTNVSIEYFKQIEESNFQQHIGQIIEKNTGINNDIWHTMYYPFKPRSYFINNSLEKCLNKIF